VFPADYADLYADVAEYLNEKKSMFPVDYADTDKVEMAEEAQVVEQAGV